MIETSFKIKILYDAYLNSDDIKKSLEDFISLLVKTEPYIFKYEFEEGE